MKRILNSHGSALMASLFASVLVVGAGTVAYKNFNINHDTVRVARIKNLMNLVESQVRRRALQPEAYLNCNSASGTSTCVVNQGFYADLNDKNLVGAKCEGGPGVRCGVRVEGAVLETGSRTFRARITYYGTEARLKPIDVVIRVPTEVLQTDQFLCSQDAPFFSGFLSNGAPDCRPFKDNATYQGGKCISGYFVKRINVSDRTVECAPLPPSIQCGDQNNEKFAKLGWVNGNPVWECAGLNDPPYTPYRNFRNPGNAPPPVVNPPVITATADAMTATVTEMRTVTVTNTQTDVSQPPPPPGPTCGPEIVYVGAGGGATPRYWGNAACTQSCVGVYGATAMCVSNCQPGYRGWYYCYDCRDHKIVCH